MFFTKKKHKVEKLVYDYLDLSNKCLLCCETSFNNFCKSNVAGDEFFEEIKNAHLYEAEGDNLRRDIEFMMYYKSLIPESRGDVLGLLEAVDRLPNKAEAILREIYQTAIAFPEVYLARLQELYVINMDAAKKAITMCYTYFQSPDEISSLQKEIAMLESKSDRREILLTREVMTSDLDTLHKLSMKELIRMFGQTSNIAEDIADRIKLLSVKTIF
jgi:predicted phosphate transport protein (TIGR00153 family)